MTHTTAVFRYGVKVRRHEFYVLMEEFGRLSGSIDQAELDLVEREAILKFSMWLSSQLHLSSLSVSNTA